MTTLTSKAREEIKGLIKGSILVPDDPGYEEARHDRSPTGGDRAVRAG